MIEWENSFTHSIILTFTHCLPIFELSLSFTLTLALSPAEGLNLTLLLQEMLKTLSQKTPPLRPLLGLGGILLLSVGSLLFADVEFRADPAYLEARGGLVVAIWGVVLLCADMLLPLPSTVVLIGLGAAFGPWVGGALGLVGLLMGNLLGFYLGQMFRPFAKRWVGQSGFQKGQAFLHRWGPWGLLLSRPVPALAELVIMVAGLGGMRLRQVWLPVLLGLLPTVIVFAWLGDYALQIDGQWLRWGLLAGVVIGFAIMGSMWGKARLSVR